MVGGTMGVSKTKILTDTPNFQIMKLSEFKIKSAKIKKKPYKIFDGMGLYLLIKPNGSKLWRLKFRFNRKENIYSIGIYPLVSLATARDQRYLLKKQLSEGINISKKKYFEKLQKETEQQSTFGNVALEWHKKNSLKWTKEHSEKLKGWIENEINPIIGFLLISDIKSPHIQAVIRKIEQRGSIDVARRVLSICSQVLRYGMPLGLCNYDVTVGLSNTLQYVKKENHKCIPVEELPALMLKIKSHNSTFLTKQALLLIAYTFVRSGELRFAKWTEINFDKKEWRIPAERMKMKEIHIVPLSIQVIEIFKKIKCKGLSDTYVFPSERNPNKVMSENTMLFSLYDIGYRNKMTVHGFRQIASTLLNELGYNPDAIERQLSHAERNNVRRAYNHAQYLSERTKMMQEWADYVDSLKSQN